jgi:hypothetical protein
MEKPKIVEIISKEYGQGRIDLFKIKSEKDLRKSIIPLLISFSVDEEESMDADSENYYAGDYLFFSGEDVKIHIFVDEENVNLVIDSNQSKKEIIDKMESFFRVLE